MTISLVSQLTRMGTANGTAGTGTRTETVSGATGDLVLVAWGQRITNVAPTASGDLTLTPIHVMYSATYSALGLWYAFLPDDADYDVTVSGVDTDTRTYAYGLAVFRGVDSGTPVEAVSSGTFDGPSFPGDVTVPSMTTTVDDALDVTFMFTRDDNSLIVQTSGYDTVWSDSTTSGGDAAFLLATHPMPSSGSSGSVVIRETASPGDPGSWARFALLPASSPTPSPFTGWGVPV